MFIMIGFNCLRIRSGVENKMDLRWFYYCETLEGCPRLWLKKFPVRKDCLGLVPACSKVLGNGKWLIRIVSAPIFPVILQSMSGAAKARKERRLSVSIWEKVV